MEEMKEENLDLDNREFQQVMQLIEFTNSSVFMTGKAGTGKSTFMRYITRHTHKKHVVLAPTGIAAINAGGQTLHSFFHIPFKPLLPEDPEFSHSRLRNRMKYSRQFLKMLRDLELIIIDEISMVRADIIDFIDKVLRYFCNNSRQPFGGKQILMVGDIFQLEPVVTAETREILRHSYKSFYFFGARVFADFQIVPIELRKVYRQTDADFIALLDRVRSGNPAKQDLDAINSRYIPGFDHTHPQQGDEMVMTIATRRDIVAYINNSRLEQLTSKPYTFTAEIKGEFPESSFPTDRELTLKKDAQVVFVRNDTDKRWVNGTIGKVAEVDNDTLRVLLENGNEYTLEPEMWENIEYHYDEEKRTVSEEVKGTFMQYPLRLAWALTIHKSQGLTFNRIVIDFGQGTFAGGQGYVALSRCTSLGGIGLASAVQSSDIYVNPQVSNFSHNFNNPQLVHDAMASARADSLYAEAAKAFNAGQFDHAVKAFAEAVETRNELPNRLAQRAITQKLYALDSVRNALREMQHKMARQQAMLNNLADEFVSLGNVCLSEGWDYKPALANFDKALSLNPDNYLARVGRGRAMLQSGDRDAAIEILGEAARLYDRYEARYELGCLYLSIGDLQNAIKQLKKAQESDPKVPEIHDALADTYEATGNDEQAARHRARAKSLRDKRKKSE